MESVYIHIPFCKSICSYCDFCKMYYHGPWVTQYLNALLREIEERYEGEEIKTLYIGGGTPSSLSSKDLKYLFEILSKFNLASDAEVTFECNLNDINEELLSLLKNAGVNRLSIIYHGGEPLLWGIELFEKAIQFQNELRVTYPKLAFRNSVQTNGSLLDAEYIEFFKANNFNIGISIDGPDEINFHKNKKGNKVVFENMKKMRDAGCSFGILSVITNEHAGWAERYYDFL